MTQTLESVISSAEEEMEMDEFPIVSVCFPVGEAAESINGMSIVICVSCDSICLRKKRRLRRIVVGGGGGLMLSSMMTRAMRDSDRLLCKQKRVKKRNIFGNQTQCSH